MLLQGTDAAYIFLRGTLERREHLGRRQKWKERGDSVSTLSDTTAGKGEKRQRGAIRDELFMTSSLRGRNARRAPQILIWNSVFVCLFSPLPAKYH